MTDDAERLADDVVSVMGDLPTLSDMADDDTVTVSLNWFVHPRKDDTQGFSIGAVFGIDSETWVSYVETNVEPLIDRRTLKESGTTKIGTLTVRGDGTIARHTVFPKFLKPSERDGNGNGNVFTGP